MNENPDISGLLYKKRGGFGKIMPNAWQFRFFAISKDGILSYYDTDKPELGVFENKARGKLDLKGVIYDLILDPIESAPTPYSIQICPRNEEKWRLCAETKEDHSRWCKILDRYLHDKLIRPTNPVSYASDDEAEQKRHNLTIDLHKTRDSGDYSNPNTPKVPANQAMAMANRMAAAHDPKHAVVTPGRAGHGGNKKKGLKLGNKSAFISADTSEALLVLLILNLCVYGVYSPGAAASLPLAMVLRKLFFLVVANVVVLRTLQLRASRVDVAVAAATSAAAVVSAAAAGIAGKVDSPPPKLAVEHGGASKSPSPEPKTPVGKSGEVSLGGDTSAVVSDASSAAAALVKAGGKPTPGFTFTEVFTEPRLSPSHTWCRVDHRQFNVRVGPDYNRYKKKAPSGPPIYEPFAVDVFCTKLRVDHAATRFQLPDTSHIDTHNEFVPPIVVVQIQIPSEPPTSIFSSAEDGPGWAIVMYYRISEDACNQLKDLSTASPAVKLFAEWCEKAPVDAAWRGRFKVINSCTNLEELGMPSAIVSYNAKPVLIRRTGTIFRGPNYLEMNIHVHKFANLAKQSIYLISSRCGLMFMQIGFVIEGREDKELPEAMFACVAVNKPQEDQAEFIFEDDEA